MKSASRAAAALAGLLAAGCLREHPVYEPENLLPLQAMLADVKSLLPDSVRLQILDGSGAGKWTWTGRKWDLVAIAPYRQSDGERFRMRVEGFLLLAAEPCIEILIQSDRHETIFDRCPPGKVQPAPRLDLETNDSVFAPGESLEWTLRAGVSAGALSSWVLEAKPAGGSRRRIAGGPLSGTDTLLRGTVPLPDSGNHEFSWTVSASGVQAETEWTVGVGPEPLRASAGPDTQVARGKAFELTGRASGGTGLYLAQEWEIPGDTVLDGFRQTLSIPANAAPGPDTQHFVYRVKDRRGRVAADTIQVVHYKASGVAYAILTPAGEGTAADVLCSGWASSGLTPDAMRVATGRYRVVFRWEEPPTVQPDIQVTAIGGKAAHCMVAGVERDSKSVSADLSCFDPAGGPVDASVSVSAVPPLRGAGSNTYATTALDSFSGVHLAPGDQAWYLMAPVQAIRSGEGRYSAEFRSGISMVREIRNAMVTAVGPSGAWCSHSPDPVPPPDIIGSVACFAPPGGKAADSRFSLSWMGTLDGRTDFALGFALVPDSAAAPHPATLYNSAGGPVEIARSGTGRYAVKFAGLPGPASDRPVAAHTAAAGPGNSWCQAFSLDGAADLTVQVRCFDAAGAPADARFSLRVLR